MDPAETYLKTFSARSFDFCRLDMQSKSSARIFCLLPTTTANLVQLKTSRAKLALLTSRTFRNSRVQSSAESSTYVTGATGSM